MPDGPSPLDRLALEVDRRKSGAPIVRVRGELDMATAPLLQDELDTLLSESVDELALDLSEVPFCDVAALNLLLRVQAELSMHGGRLKLLGPCRSLEVMVAALGLGRLVCPTAGDRDGRAREEGAGRA
jgi:anti-sigma B factor antagonist